MLFYLTILGCDDHKFTGGHSSDVEIEGEDYGAVQAILEGNSCTGCHAGGVEPNLTEDLCVSVVGVTSSQFSSMLLIEAGSSGPKVPCWKPGRQGAKPQ